MSERAFGRGAMTKASRLGAAVILSLLAAPAVSGAETHLAAAEVKAIVASGRTAGKILLAGRDMAGDDLTGLDLSGADLRGAKLARANLHGVKLVGADLTGADLAGADLTFAWIIRANFSRATLRNATLQTMVTSTAMDNSPAEAANFTGADLSGASMTVHFSFDKMAGANFSHAMMSADMRNQSMGLLRTEFASADLRGANFTGTGLAHVLLRFARLDGATFAGADLTGADFTGAYLRGADFTGAKTGGANFDSADLRDTKGLPATPAPAAMK